MVDKISSTLDHLINDVLTPQESLQGCSDSDIEAVMADQNVDRLPSAYVCFLRRIGRGAGRFLQGTDAFFPQIIGLKDAAEELFEENGVPISLEDNSLVIAMHQGYQVFWFPTVKFDDPKVAMFQEGDQGILREWDSFSAYLNDMIKSIER